MRVMIGKAGMKCPLVPTLSGMSNATVVLITVVKEPMGGGGAGNR
jgi:hypothetical protein